MDRVVGIGLREAGISLVNRVSSQLNSLSIFHVTGRVRSVLGTGQDESGSWDEAIL